MFDWTAAVGVSLSSHLADIRNHSESVVTEGARNMFRMVQLTRLWNSQHGGVYVLVDGKSPPNPYLKHPHRDIQDTLRLSLTLINPAYMTRLTGEQVLIKTAGWFFYLTSLETNQLQTIRLIIGSAEALIAFESGNQKARGV
ncbi:MAG: hypothetical protein U5M23_08470 [Marinagarivorans sp.]|nr:hypothetical protein [Marinagarivorans sp.]